MILHEFPIVLLKYSKNSHYHHLPFLMMRHTRKIWLGGRATAFPFWMKIREWKGGRATWFPFSIKIHVSRWGSATLTSFFGQKSNFRAIEGEEGLATCFFGATKGRSTQAKREKHASLPGRRLHSSGTLLPFSYGILLWTRVLPVPLSQKSEDLEGYVFKMRMSI